METDRILKLRALAVEINKLMTEFNDILLDEFQDKTIDCGCGYTIEKPKLPARCFKDRKVDELYEKYDYR